MVAIFSCFSGKQIHYLFPVFPFAAIWVANRLRPEKFTTEPAVIAMLAFVAIAILSSPLWVEKVFRSAQITEVYQSWALLPVAFMALLLWKRPLPFERLALNLGALMLSLSALLASLSPILNNLYDVTDIGRHIHQLQARGASVSFVGKYHNTFGYAGRLEAPLNLIPGSKEQRDAFLSTEPGYTVWIQRKKTDPLAENAVYMTPFRGKWLFIMDNQMLEKILQENQTNNLVVAEDS